MKHYKGVIFDLDGTLLDTLVDLADSVNEAMEQLGCPTHPTSAYRLKVGKGFRNLIEVSLPEDQRTTEMINKGVALFDQAYAKRYQNKTAPYEGITKLLEQLDKDQVPIGINSNKRTDYTEALVQKFFPNINFIDVFGQREGIPKKPDPSAALELAKMMGYEPKDILYVGDSSTDMQTGKNAGMDTIGVSWGFRGRKELEEHGATYVVDDPVELYKKIME